MTARQMSSSSFHYPTKVLNFIDTRPKDNEVKGAVKLDPMLREYLLSAAVEESSSDDSSSSVDQSFVAFLQQKLANAIPTTFAVFDKQHQPLSDFVAQLCSQMGLLGADEEQKAAAVDGRAAVRRHFALMFDDRRSFLTEANKHGLQQGFILKLTASPANYARHFLTKLGSRRPQLSLLNSMCADCAFAEAFHQQQGIQRLANMIEEAADWHPFFDSNGSGSLLLGLMHALLQLMQMYPQLVPWSSISSQFVRKIAFLVNGQSKLEQNDSRALALDMLLVLAEHCDHLHECLKREVPVDSLIRHLDNTDQRVLLGSTRLMNAIYVLGERAERICIVKLLHERPFLAAIGRVLAREGSSSIPGSSQVGGPAAAARTSTATTSPPPPPSLPPSPISEQRAQLWEQLARLQHIRFDEVRALALRSPSDMEIDFLKKLEAFNGGIAGDDLFESAAAYGNDGAEAAAEEGNHLYGNIVGFQQQRRQQSSDWEQFREIVRSTPPGLLAICAILDLTQPPQPAAILQQQQQQSPEEAASAAAMAANQAWARLQELDAHFIGRPSLFPQILARLAQMLLQVLGICGESSVGQRFGHQRLPHFWRLVLTCERPFYDLFRTVVELFYRTWRDMNAKPEELGKVFSVVQDQLERAMVEDPESLEQLEREMLRKRFSYFNMQKIWKREQLEQEELELNSEDIQPLRDHLRPKFERLVLQRRISLLKKGLTFQRVLPAKPKDPQNTPLSSPASLPTASLAFSSSTAVHSSPVHSGHVNLHQQQPQHWFWRLDERERHFHVWDCGGGKHKELVLDSQEKLPISQIRAVLHGPELVARLQQQHGLKPQKKGQNVLRCGLGLETQLAAAQEYFLCAQTEQELASWLEALNCLCWPQKALENAALRAEVDRLLGMEVHIRLMDIPPQQPKHKKPSAAEVPELPTDLQSWIPQNMLLQPERA